MDKITCSLTKFLLIAVSLQAAVPAQAGMEEWIQEFFIAESALPQEKEEVQVTLGYEQQREDSLKERSMSVLIEYGITDRFQVEGEVPYVKAETRRGHYESGVGDSSVGVLYNIVSEKNRGLSASLELELPTGDEDKGLGEDETVWEPRLIAATEAGRFQVHASIGCEIEDDETNFLSDIGVVSKVREIRPSLELNGVGGPREERFITPGFTVPIIDDMEVGVGFPLPLTAQAPKDNLVMKATYEFGGSDEDVD